MGGEPCEGWALCPGAPGDCDPAPRMACQEGVVTFYSSSSRCVAYDGGSSADAGWRLSLRSPIEPAFGAMARSTRRTVHWVLRGVQ